MWINAEGCLKDWASIHCDLVVKLRHFVPRIWLPVLDSTMCTGPFSGQPNQELVPRIGHWGFFRSACLIFLCGRCSDGLLALWVALFDVSLSNEETVIHYHQRVVHVRELLELPCTFFSQFLHRCGSCPNCPPATVNLVLQFLRPNNDFKFFQNLNQNNVVLY